jgi:zinc protease
MTSFRTTLALALILAGAPYPAMAADAAYPAPVHMTQLANGMRVLYAPDTSMATVDVSTWYASGTRYERAGHTGLTHLFDGLLFGGSAHYPAGDHQRIIQREGGTLGVFSTPDYACATENVPPAALGTALKLEADRMESLTLNARNLEAARAAMRREREGGAESTAMNLGLRRLYEAAFAGHPYRWPATGVASDLPQITLADAETFYRDHYGPDGALLTLVGRFDPAEAETLVARTFGAIPRRHSLRLEPAALKPQLAERRVSGHVDAPVPLLVLGWRTPGSRDADAAALDVIDQLIAHGSPSPLEKKLVGDPALGCLAVRAGLALQRDAGLFYVVAGVRPDADTAQVERAVLAEIQKLADHAPEAADLLTAQHQIEVETLYGWQSTQGLGRAIGTSVCLEGDPTGAARHLERIRALTPAAVRNTASRMFTHERRTVVWLRPGAAPPAKAPPAHAPHTTAKTTKGAH